MWWAIQLSLNDVYIGKFGSERNVKIGECLAKLQTKGCLVCPVRLAMVLLKDKEQTR